jgi:hypothetical protein
MRVLNVEKLIETQSQKHRERLLSKHTLHLDSSPVFAVCYDPDPANSTAEIGTRDIMQYVGDDSPVRFNRIEGLPVYSVNPIVANIVYDETLGTYTEFEDDCLFLQSTIQPVPGMHMVFPSFNPEIIFAITDVKLRPIRGEDHYVATYEVVKSSRLLKIDKQVIQEYKCIFRNIGTTEQVIIKVEDYLVLQDYLESYRLIHSRYVDDFFDPRYSYLRTPEWLDNGVDAHGSCKYLIRFLMDHRILYFDEILETIFAFEMVLPWEARHNKLYQQKFPLLRIMKGKFDPGSVYTTFSALPITVFTALGDDKFAQSTDFQVVPVGEDFTPGYRQVQIYNDRFSEIVASKDYTTASPLEKVVAKFINKEDITVAEYEEIIDDYDVDDVFRMYFIPIALASLKILIRSIQTRGNK